MPLSTNSMEAIYDLPDLPKETIEQMIACPWETISDSFYFVENKMVLHTRALFNYEPCDEWSSIMSYYLNLYAKS